MTGPEPGDLSTDEAAFGHVGRRRTSTDPTNAQETVERNENTNTCERCGDAYEPYTVFVRDDPEDLAAQRACEWDNLCKPCRLYVTDYGAFLTESEREELEPKRTVEAESSSDESQE